MSKGLYSVASVCTLALAVVTSHPARASIITLSGGDTGEGSDSIGFAPRGINVYAYHFATSSGAPTYTMHGVNFAPIFLPFAGATVTAGSVTVTNGAVYPGGASFVGVSPNDVALQNIGSVIAQGVSHGGPSPFT